MERATQEKIKKLRRRFADSDEEQQQTIKVCSKCSQVVPAYRFSEHRQQCSSEQACKFCHAKLPPISINEHQTLCRKNPRAKALRKLYPSSSDQQDSSDEGKILTEEEIQRRAQGLSHYEKERYIQMVREEQRDLYGIRPPLSRQSSEESEKQERRSSEQKQKMTEGERWVYERTHPPPRRQYTLSESSSEQDERTRYWRNYREQFASRELPVTFYVRSLKTDIPGVSISVSSDGRHGRVIRRTLHNSITRQMKTISEHRFRRHYASHVIQDSAQEEGAQILVISNQEEREGLNKKELEGMERYKAQQDTTQEGCAICCSEYHKGEDLMKLKCNHTFHSSCVEQWLAQKSFCPLCKHQQKGPVSK